MKKVSLFLFLAALIGIASAFTTVNKSFAVKKIQAIDQVGDRIYVADADEVAPGFQEVDLTGQVEDTDYLCSTPTANEKCTLQLEDSEMGEAIFDNSRGLWYFDTDLTTSISNVVSGEFSN